MRILLGVLIVPPVMLFLFQHRLIYFPTAYTAGDLAMAPKNLQRLSYTTAAGRQVAYFLPPASRPVAAMDRVWVLFPGNAMRALDWLGFILSWQKPTDGFLLIDYPGYGACEGSASPGAIEKSSRAAFAEWLKTRGNNAPAPKIGVLGLSLGSAAALQFATHHPVDKVILIAPFVTTLEEAKRLVGVPLCYVLRHRFDNRARLAELAAQPVPPKVWIFHGTEDVTIPPSRGRALKAAFPQLVTYQEVAEGDHNSTLEIAQEEILAVMKDENPAR